MRLFHGGIAGLNPGDWIMPASKTGISRHHETTPTKPHYTYDRVYVTSGLDYAQMFAYLRDGAVYEVRPRGSIRPDLDSRVAPSRECRRALIVAVVVSAPAPMPHVVPENARAWLGTLKSRDAFGQLP